MPKIKIPKDEYENIVDMHNQGVSRREIAEIYNVCTTAITQILIKCGIRVYKQHNPIPTAYHDTIISLYKDGYSLENISEIYNSYPTYISNILNEYNIQCRHQPLDFSIKEVRNMYALYCNGIKITDISKQYNIDVSSVYKLFKQNGLQVKNNEEAHRKYTINEYYFDEINTPNKAYILGLLFADGCNSTTKSQVDISLQEEDRHILEDIKNEIEINKPLGFKNYHDKNPNHKNQYSLSITCKHMSDTLFKLGMVDAKSLILEFPEWLNKDLYSHFIRGYFDGDGCLYLGNNLNCCEVTIVSTVMFIEKIIEILAQEINVTMRIKTQKQHKPVTKVGVITGRNKIAMFLDWIYQDAELKLNRKYKKYQEFMAIYNNISNSCAS